MSSSLDQVDHPTRFVGRATELEATKQILGNGECRLLTLVGVGGSGKTRLAIQLAKSEEHAFGHGAWFVNLQPLQSGRQIASAVADAMGVALAGHEAPESQLLHYLQDKQALLLLDNFEHVLDGVPLLAQIVQRAPSVKLLVSSREALGLPEEWLYPVEGLAFPTDKQWDAPESMAAVELFVERARQVNPGFSFRANRTEVVRICQLVGGLPLALEMAASWTRLLLCSEIAAEIQHSLSFLSSNLRHVPERHRSMQAVLAQTWEHLTESEQALFKRLAVFRGGFQREAAAVIAGATLPVLSALLEKCLIRREAGGRYQVHELLRQYANSKLSRTEIEMLAEAHCRYYCEFFGQRNAGLVEREQVKNSLEIEDELENLRAAWQHAVVHRQLDQLRKAAAPYFYFCQIQSRYLEYVDASRLAADDFEAAASLPDLAQILVYQAWMLIRVGRFEEAAAGLARSRALFADLQLTADYGMGSHPLAPLVVLAVIQGDYVRAVSLGEQLKLEMAAAGDKENLGFACYGLTSAYLKLGQVESALENGQEALKLFVEIGNHWISAYVHIEVGNVYEAIGDYAAAERHYRESLGIKQCYRDPEGVAVTAGHLGRIARLKHDYPAARQLYEQSLSVYQTLNDQGGLANAHHGLGQVAFKLGEPARAARHLHAALEIADRIEFVPLLLAVLIDVAVLMLDNDQHLRGAQLLQLVAEHPASSLQQREMAAAQFQRSGTSQETPRPDLETTIRALQAELPDLVPVPPASPVSALIEPLTERELEVLSLIMQGLSNPAIAERLILSVGTVKTHTNRIYGKLGVRNRVEAVNRAQALSLVNG